MNIHDANMAFAAHSLSGLPAANFVVITPYLLPPGIAKRVNVGDGFILHSALRLLGLRPQVLLSSRSPLTAVDIERINASKCVLAIGANTLKDNFELTPGFSLATLKQLKVPVILMGVGHYGVAEMTRRLSPSSVELFRAILERFPVMSVRCDASRQYVVAAMPDQSDRILMTSCPVVHPVDGIDRGFALKAWYDQLVVTLTDRSHLQAQVPLLTVAKSFFPAKRRILALHQDYQNKTLWKFAAEQGYEVFRGDDYAQFLSLYQATDIHIGNRVHAHLKCLSLGVRSFCTPFDLRQAYFAQSLDYPLISAVPSPELATYDFSRMVARRISANCTMQSFVAALRTVI